MAIERKDVVHVARLARLELTEAEIERMMSDLRSIIGYVEKLGELDTEGVVPTAHVAVEAAPLRADEVAPCFEPDVALREAPRQSGGGFAVPAFVEEG